VGLETESPFHAFEECLAWDLGDADCPVALDVGMTANRSNSGVSAADVSRSMSKLVIC